MSTFSVDTFIDATILLMKSQDEKSVDLVNDLINLYTEELKTNASQDTTLNRSFIQLLEQLKRLPVGPDSKAERMSLLAKFLTKDEIKQEDVFCSALNSLFTTVEDDDKLNVSRLQKKLSNNVLYNKFSKKCKRMWNKLNLYEGSVDEDKQDMYLNDAINIAREIIEITQTANRLDSGAIERIIFSDEDSLMTGRQKFKDREVKGILKTGLQGLNMMLGERGGFVLGESVCIFALLHNFKSGLLMTIARGLACYNDPNLLPNPLNKKPLILFVSLENEANRNMDWLYKTAYEGTYRKSCKGLTDSEVIHFVRDFYTRRGFEFIMERRIGRFFGFEEYAMMIESYEAQGYLVVACLLDYAEKMRKAAGTDFSKSNAAYVLGELFNNLCNYNKAKDILFITAHQLNREAMELVGQKNNAVKYFSARVAAKSIDISQEVDLEIFIHLEKNASGKKFLTMQRGKHRYVDNTPEKHKYVAYAFTDFGIEDDINGPAQFVRDIYAVGDDDDESDTNAMLDEIYG